jgi:type IV pilus assembly protein PilM
MKRFLTQHYSPIGLEISSDSVLMVQVKRSSGQWRVHRAAQEALPPQEPESEDAGSRLSELIKGMIKNYSFSGRQVVSTLPNRDVDILPLRVPVSDENGLEEKIIENARARLSYAVEQAVIDYVPIDGLQGVGGKERSLWVVAVQRSLVEKHLAAIKGAGLRNKAVDIQPCALVRALVESGHEVDGKILLIHIGDRDSVFLLVENGGPLAQRVCPKGYHDMADKLQVSLNTDKTTAFRLLSDFGFIDETTDEERSEIAGPARADSVVQEIILPVFEEILKGLKNFVDYCHAEMREVRVERTCLSGKACLVRNLDRMLEKSTDTKTEVVNPLASVCADEALFPHIDIEHGSVFSVPFGLTLRG